MSVTLMTRLDPAERTELSVPEGATVSEIVAIVLPGLLRLEHVRVVIGEHVIPKENWAHVRPKVGARVLVRVIPGNNGLLRSVLQVAVTIAALTVSGGLLAPLGAAVGLGEAVLGAGTLGANIAAAATLVAGNLLINALIPIRDGNQTSNESPTYSINGMRNVANPGGVIPRALGHHRWAPPYAALPYTEVIGDDRYIVASFLCGYGPLNITNLKIGDTPIEKFLGVTTEVRQGYADDDPLNLYPKQVLEEALSINVTNLGGANSRFTATDCTEASIDIAFQQGLIAFNPKNGDSLPIEVVIDIRYRPAAGGSWTSLPALHVVGKTQQPFVRSYRWSFPSRGQYEVEVSRASADFEYIPTVKATGRSDWSALRSFRPEYPIAFHKPLALVSIRIKASNQLNGTLDEFNVETNSYLPDWDTEEETWITRETSNPASHFRHVLTGNAIAYPLNISEMEALEEWHEFCTEKGLAYNRIHDFDSTVLEVLSDIAAAGRATPRDTGSKWGVVVDRIQTIVRGHISPRNSWGFSGSIPFTKFPDAWRIKFKDESYDYQDSERIVPRPGFVGDPQVTEELALPGITDPDLIWKEGRRRWYELLNRPGTYNSNQDFEHFAYTRGDLVRLSHDVIDRTQVSARVVRVITETSQVVLDEEVQMEAGIAYACRFRLSDGTSVVRTVMTMAGETSLLNLTGVGSLPEAGDLAMFGQASQETIEAIVKAVEVSDDLVAQVTLVDHAPQIETLTDADTPPAWNGRVGAELDPSTVAPGVPVISSIVSGTQSDGENIVVSVVPGSGIVIPDTFVIDHRLVGAGSWTSVSILAAAGAAYIAGYSKGDSVEVRALASAGAYSSDYSSPITHEVGGNDPTIQDVSTFSATWTGTTWRYEWAFETLVDGMTAAAGVKVRFGIGTGLAWEDLTPLHTGLLIASPWDMTVPAELDPGDSYTFGAMAVSVEDDDGTPVLTTVTA